MKTTHDSLHVAYASARERYAAWGVDTERALEVLAATPLSLPCWQGDDVTGFEGMAAGGAGGGIAVTGSHPGRARCPEELRADLRFALSLIPGRHRVNLHAMYGEFGDRAVDRDAIEPAHYAGWVEFAREEGIGLDFNATCFSHPRAALGVTLSSRDAETRRFWIEHVRRCRAIAAWIGGELGNPCVHDLWIPDGSKDLTVARHEGRWRLLESLDAVYANGYPRAQLRDAVESKLFGIGTESYVTGSFEFYFGWVMRDAARENPPMLCLDLGHFHPTESVADKISSILCFQREILLHLSRGVRWDSDHVVIASDELRSVMEEIVRADALGRVHLALDSFDAEMNRVGAWVIGARAAQRALLAALLEPIERLRRTEAEGDRCARLALMEECRTMPAGAVWDWFCARMGVPAGDAWIASAQDYERRVLRQRV